MPHKSFTDQLSRIVEISYPPKRIISIVPSQTELLFDLGLDEEIIAITRFCIYPKEKVKAKIKIGGTKTLDIPAIRALKPDLIIGNKEENDRVQMESLMAEFPVWLSDMNTLDEALLMIAQIGEVCCREQNAKNIIKDINSKFSSLAFSHSPELSVAYFIWKNPYMVAGSNTFINDMIKFAGWKNAFSDLRYPEISADRLQEANPEIILLSSEPYPFKEKHIAEFQSICPNSKIKVVNGELFSWYGSRLLHSPEYFYQLKQQFDTAKSN